MLGPRGEFFFLVSMDLAPGSLFSLSWILFFLLKFQNESRWNIHCEWGKLPSFARGSETAGRL